MGEPPEDAQQAVQALERWIGGRGVEVAPGDGDAQGGVHRGVAAGGDAEVLQADPGLAADCLQGFRVGRDCGRFH
jgi:hypothetical protein